MQIKYHLSLITLIVWILMVANAQFVGYHKFFEKLHKPIIGQYHEIKDGRYHKADDGSYRHGNEGRYIHQNIQDIDNDHRSDGRYISIYNPEETHGDSTDSTDDLQGYYQQNRLGFSFGKGSKSNNNRFTVTDTRTPIPRHIKPIRFHNAGRKKASAKMHSTKNFTNTFQGFQYSNTAAKPSKIYQSANKKILAGDNKRKPLQKGDGTAEGRGDWEILHLEKEQNDDNSYHYRYETENGISAEELGQLERLGSDVVLRSIGFYEYTGDDGLLYRVDYTADEDGFVAHGDHIPETPANNH